jgi:hypothetical protein
MIKEIVSKDKKKYLFIKEGVICKCLHRPGANIIRLSSFVINAAAK